ncbi:hypothetical protein CLOACE_18390 [Clostridium acetireducens DSM 10703]|uniref:DUF3784 domain-containing protein n=1 Tax=Clostridium acetireducens DSM 10703 TaxID=1121290 RepID=A0A1E8EWZ7_9CLOT|nr:hypothetical protein [Clostridium acetireducens]OFI05315.1 hypothetical protein CLOACE_18390 [Clostridium acetireducens DSM 10703]
MLYVSSISLSYLLLGIGILSIAFYLYFRILISKTSESNDSKDKIIGAMNNPELWKKRNIRMSYVSLFWAIVSILLFIYLKFYFNTSLISMLYIFVYLALIVISLLVSNKKDKIEA